MEEHMCEIHDEPCMLKTCLKEGPHYGRHFYICNHVTTDTGERCTYFKKNRDAELMECPHHAKSSVELRTLFYDITKDETSLFYRCKEGLNQKLKWCGHNQVNANLARKGPLRDIDRKAERQARRSDPGQPQKKTSSGLAGKWSKSSSHIRSSPEQRSNQSSAVSNPRGKIANITDSRHVKAAPVTKGGASAATGEKNTQPRDTPNFASLSLQRKMKEFSLEGNESLLISPRSGVLKYRSQIGKDNVQDSDSESDSEDKISSYDSESDDDCKVVAVESPKHKPEPEIVNPISPAQPAPSVATSAPVVAKPGPTPGTKVLTFKSVAERDAYLASLNTAGKVVKILPAADQSASDAVRRGLLKVINEKASLVRTRDKQVQLLKTIDKSKLPDGGIRLRKVINELDGRLEMLNKEIARRQKEVAQLPQTGSVPVSQSEAQAPTAGAGGMRQMKLTDMVNLPPHALQQMYAAEPQMMTLYGGRMTAARLREVGSVTTEAIERLHKQLETMPGEDEEMEDPRKVKVPLMTHQRQALSWLMWREQQQPSGGILADDMGLGKTLTMISLVLKDKEMRRALEKQKKEEEDEDGWTSKDKQIKKFGKSLVESDATLVVCPASLVHQWGKEIERRSSRSALRVVIYHGPNREQDIQVLAGSDMVLTTYSLVGREVGAPPDAKSKTVTDMPATDAEMDEEGKSQPQLLRIAWRRIILDEAHSIKNHKSLTAMSVCRLRAGRRWALTGTPIQNELLDMYSLLRFLRCSPFDELKVWKRQVDNRSAAGQKRLNTLIKSLLLRRTKDQTNKQGDKLVALPDKHVVTHELELSADERKIYEKIFQQSKTTLQNYLNRAEEKQHIKEHGLKPAAAAANPWAGVDSPGKGITNPTGGASQARGGGVGGSQILLMLLRLRQCCSHLSLTKDALDAEVLEKDDGIDLDIVEQMGLMALKEEAALEEPNAAPKTTVFSTDNPSSKIASLLDHLIEIRDDKSKGRAQKSVIVSQWTQMLAIVERHVKKVGLRCATIKGDIPPKRRTEMVDAFNTDPDGPEVMLLSLRAGGVGLNLVGGNHLFLIDMHWNPALEAQACDRIYRVGQKLEVKIHRFICKDTIEEKILQLQRKKTDLANDVLSGAEATANKLSLQDLKMLFGLDQPQPRFHGASGFDGNPSHSSVPLGATGGHPQNYRPIQPAIFKP